MVEKLTFKDKMEIPGADELKKKTFKRVIRYRKELKHTQDQIINGKIKLDFKEAEKYRKGKILLIDKEGNKLNQKVSENKTIYIIVYGYFYNRELIVNGNIKEDLKFKDHDDEDQDYYHCLSINTSDDEPKYDIKFKQAGKVIDSKSIKIETKTKIKQIKIGNQTIDKNEIKCKNPIPVPNKGRITVKLEDPAGNEEDGYLLYKDGEKTKGFETKFDKDNEMYCFDNIPEVDGIWGFKCKKKNGLVLKKKIKVKFVDVNIHIWIDGKKVKNTKSFPSFKTSVDISWEVEPKKYLSSAKYLLNDQKKLMIDSKGELKNEKLEHLEKFKIEITDVFDNKKVKEIIFPPILDDFKLYGDGCLSDFSDKVYLNKKGFFKNKDNEVKLGFKTNSKDIEYKLKRKNGRILPVESKKILDGEVELTFSINDTSNILSYQLFVKRKDKAGAHKVIPLEKKFATIPVKKNQIGLKVKHTEGEEEVILDKENNELELKILSLPPPKITYVTLIPFLYPGKNKNNLEFKAEFYSGKDIVIEKQDNTTQGMILKRDDFIRDNKPDSLKLSYGKIETEYQIKYISLDEEKLEKGKSNLKELVKEIKKIIPGVDDFEIKKGSNLEDDHYQYWKYISELKTKIQSKLEMWKNEWIENNGSSKNRKSTWEHFKFDNEHYLTVFNDFTKFLEGSKLEFTKEKIELDDFDINYNNKYYSISLNANNEKHQSTVVVRKEKNGEEKEKYIISLRNNTNIHSNLILLLLHNYVRKKGCKRNLNRFEDKIRKISTIERKEIRINGSDYFQCILNIELDPEISDMISSFYFRSDECGNNLHIQINDNLCDCSTKIDQKEIQNCISNGYLELKFLIPNKKFIELIDKKTPITLDLEFSYRSKELEELKGDLENKDKEYVKYFEDRGIFKDIKIETKTKLDHSFCDMYCPAECIEWKNIYKLIPNDESPNKPKLRKILLLMAYKNCLVEKKEKDCKCFFIFYENSGPFAVLYDDPGEEFIIIKTRNNNDENGNNFIRVLENNEKVKECDLKYDEGGLSP